MAVPMIYEEIADLIWGTSHGAYLRSIGWDQARLVTTIKTNCPDPARARFLFIEAHTEAARLMSPLAGILAGRDILDRQGEPSYGA